ncbi:MFS transporter [Naasia aerilata]|uniref:MFS transporter n=1 Tax=Naasia aerilata TaxID=1162966 RepID=UPI0025741DA6|nr:MFS transporter [Naasia aerilata]
MGIWGGISGLGVATGPLVGGAIVEGWNWQSIFWINVPIGVVSVVLAALVLAPSVRRRVRLDLLGTLLAGAGTLAVVFGIVRGNDAGWTSAQVLGALIGGAVLLAAFLAWERRVAAPLLPLRLFRDRSFSIANVVGFGFSFGMFGAIFLLIQFLQVVQGASPFQAALQTTPWTLAPMVIAPLAGLFGTRIGSRTLITAGLTAEAVSSSGLPP